MESRFILPLSDPRATLENVGGKGMSLARLANAGLPVPDGFHVTTPAYQQFVTVNDLQPRIIAALALADASRPDTLETASSAIRELFAAAPIPTTIADDIRAAYLALANESSVIDPQESAVAVRSSATAEDLPGLSFAGQQETFLNIRGVTAVPEVVKKCWASLWTARAIGYRAQNKIDHRSVSLAVTVQLLVAADAAGVTFTANPITGQRDQAVITATWGLGEAIVGGLVTPDTLTVDKASGKVLKRETADKQVMTARTESGTAEQPTPESLRRAPVLSDSQAAELTRLGVQIETLYGMPMDIEWTLTLPSPSGRGASPELAEGAGGEGRFAIVQARPITALPPAPVQWVRPNPKIVYARSSLAEHLPNPVTPLFGTLGLRLANRATDELCWQMFKAGAETISYEYVPVNGYTYLSVALTPRAVWLYTKASFALLKPILTTGTWRWREARDVLAEVVKRWAALDVASLSATRLLEGAREIMLQVGRYYTVIQSGTLPTATSSEVIFARVYNSLVKRKGDPEATTFLFGFDTLPMLAEKALFDLAVWLPQQPALLDYARRASTEELAGDWRGERPPSEVPIEAWNEWRARFGPYLERFGHMIYEFDFANPTSAEEPQALFEALKLYLDGRGVNPYERQRAAAERRERATQQVLARLGWPVRNWFVRALKWAQTSGPLREESLADLGLGHSQIRNLLGELGRRVAAAGTIKTAGDIYWLVEAEVNELVQRLERGEPLPDFSERVPSRHAEWRRLLKATPPATLPETSLLTRMMPWARSGGESNIIHGLGASAGKVTATARVLLSPEDFGRMKPGEVLVAVTTTPAWTPLFALASAVVTDIGGPLSHSSIVAREYGIPAVLATGLGTRRIRDGQIITVDGSAGTVTLKIDDSADAGSGPVREPKDWKLPKGAYAALRNNIVELMADPLSPLFVTLGLSAINTSLHRLLNESFGMRGIMPKEIILPVNGYAYNNGSLSAGGLGRLLFDSPRIIRKMFTGAVERWAETGRPGYVQAVAAWQAKNWRTFSSVELLNSAEQLTGAAIDAYGALISGAIPAAWMSEAAFTAVYDWLIKRREDPPAATYLLGYDSLPIRADKSLYSLAEWARQQPALRAGLERTSSAQLAAWHASEGAPGDVPATLWQEWREHLREHLRQFGATFYDLDFAHPLPADDPTPLLETFKLYLRGQGVSPYRRQQESAGRRDRAVEAVRQRVKGWRLSWFEKYLALAQKYAPLREDGLAEIGLAYSLIRQMLRELGQRFVEQAVIGAPEDIFWLTQTEVTLTAQRLDAGLSVESLASLIPARHAEHEAARHITPPAWRPVPARSRR